MSKRDRVVIAILTAGAALYAGGWLDGQVMPEIQRQAGLSFDPNGLALAISLGSLAVAGVILLLGVLAWRSHSLAVGLTYSAVGAIAAFMPVIIWRFVAQFNDNPPLLPMPIADALTQIFRWSNGPLNATGMIGAGMLIAGILVLVRSFRRRSADPHTGSLTEPGTLPTQS